MKLQFIYDAGQKYCRMLQGQHSAVIILSTLIKLPLVVKIIFFQFFSGRFTQVLLYAKISYYLIIQLNVMEA